MDTATPTESSSATDAPVAEPVLADPNPPLPFGPYARRLAIRDQIAPDVGPYPVHVTAVVELDGMAISVRSWEIKGSSQAGTEVTLVVQAGDVTVVDLGPGEFDPASAARARHSYMVLLCGKPVLTPRGNNDGIPRTEAYDTYDPLTLTIYLAEVLVTGPVPVEQPAANAGEDPSPT